VMCANIHSGHGCFKIPFAVDENSHCKPSATIKKWLRSIHCFIWDEVSMAHRCLCDVCRVKCCEC
jgi:hypothetical protein